MTTADKPTFGGVPVNSDEQNAAIEKLNFDFTNHKPSENAQNDMVEIRGAFKALGRKIIEATGPNRERSLALTDLQKALQWSMAAIALEDARSVEEPKND